MADFAKAVDITLGLEGGHVDDPHDYGGETKFGISKRSYPHLDIVKLSVEDAKDIYKRDYWDKLRLDDVTSQAVAEEVFDTAVNCGWNKAGQMLQSSINLFLLGLETASLDVDGLVGPVTLKALRVVTRSEKNKDVLLKLLNGFQLTHYINLVERDPRYHRFMKGWISKRIDFAGIDKSLTPAENLGDSSNNPGEDTQA